jgi:ATP-dependent DNA ligase
VVAKRVDAAYRPGVRAMTKVKRLRTADCVVAGLRVHADGGVASLLLGLYDAQGQLAHVGVASSFSRSTRAELRELLAPHVVPLEGHPWQQGFGLEGGALGRLKGTAGRWTPEMQRDWLPVRPDLVAEVGYDHVQGHRFRHPARLLRWRPDRAASSCTLEQLS